MAKRTLSRNNFVLRIQPVNDGNPRHAQESNSFDTRQALIADLNAAIRRSIAFDRYHDIDFVIHIV